MTFWCTGQWSNQLCHLARARELLLSELTWLPLGSKFMPVDWSLKRVLSPLNILPLPVDTVLSFDSKGHKRDISGGRGFSFWFRGAGVLAFGRFLQCNHLPSPVPSSCSTHSFPSTGISSACCFSGIQFLWYMVINSTHQLLPGLLIQVFCSEVPMLRCLPVNSFH